MEVVETDVGQAFSVQVARMGCVTERFLRMRHPSHG